MNKITRLFLFIIFIGGGLYTTPSYSNITCGHHQSSFGSCPGFGGGVGGCTMHNTCFNPAGAATCNFGTGMSPMVLSCNAEGNFSWRAYMGFAIESGVCGVRYNDRTVMGRRIRSVGGATGCAIARNNNICTNFGMDRIGSDNLFGDFLFGNGGSDVWPNGLVVDITSGQFQGLNSICERTNRACSAGEFCAGGVSGGLCINGDCRNCPAGQVRPEASHVHTSCTACTGNNAPNAARTQCQACVAPRVANSTNSACICPSGYTAQGTGCNPCPPAHPSPSLTPMALASENPGIVARNNNCNIIPGQGNLGTSEFGQFFFATACFWYS